MKIYFQGDSITDCGRDRTNPNNMAGYTAYVAEWLGAENEYYNFGISGDRSVDVLARMDEELQIVGKPDVFTMLIGINDVWRRYDSNCFTSPDEYYANVKAILQKVKDKNKDCKIILIEPFLLPALDKLHWVEDVAYITQKLRKLAYEFGTEYIAMDGIFAKAYVSEPWQEFSLDGVHPTDKGNRLIAMNLVTEIGLLFEGK